MQPRRSQVLKRVENLERQVSELADLTANHTANVATLLVGWAEISHHCRKKPRTLSRYAKNMAFPAYRWGRHIVSSASLIDGWLLTVHQLKRQGKKNNDSKAVTEARTNR